MMSAWLRWWSRNTIIESDFAFDAARSYNPFALYPSLVRHFQKIMFDHERLISLCGQPTDVPKLLRIPDHNCTLCSIEKR